MSEFLKIEDAALLEKYLIDFEVCFPHLKEKVNINEFAIKLTKYAENYIMLECGKPIGITCFYANDSENFCGYITLIGIMPQTQKGGFGKQLMFFTLAKMQEKGMKKAKLEVDSDNINAQGFYYHLGFENEKENEKSLYLVREI